MNKPSNTKLRTLIYFISFAALYIFSLITIYNVNWDDIYFFSERPKEKEVPKKVVKKPTTSAKKKKEPVTAQSKLAQKLERIKRENKQGRELKKRLLSEFAKIDSPRWKQHRPLLFESITELVKNVDKMTLTELRNNRLQMRAAAMKLPMIDRQVRKLPLKQIEETVAKVEEKTKTATKTVKPKEPQYSPEELALINKISGGKTLDEIAKVKKPKDNSYKVAKLSFSLMDKVKLYETDKFVKSYRQLRRKLDNALAVELTNDQRKEITQKSAELEEMRKKAAVVARNIIGLEPVEVVDKPDKSDKFAVLQHESAKELGFPLEVKNRYNMYFRFIPAGVFMMGSPKNEKGRSKDEKLHQVIISEPFYMQTTEIGPRQLVYAKEANTTKAASKVTWKKAVKFCQQLNIKENQPKEMYQLPTEAMWEYACRAGSQEAAYHDNLKEIAHYDNSFSGAVQDRQQLEPNSWGLYDILGNVKELCLDKQSGSFLFFSSSPKTYVDGIKDPLSTKGSSVVVRGGGWGSSASETRAAARELIHPESREWDVGLRVVRRIYLNWEE